MADTKAVIFSDGKFQAIDNSGNVVPYGKLYFTDADSGNEITTYTTSTMETENPYPIILSASGKADVYIGDGKFNVTLQDKNSTTVWTINNYIPPGGQVQLDPVSSTETREEITGEVGDTIVLEDVPTTAVEIHKNGLLLLETDYTVEGKIITFVVPLIATDEIVAQYGQLSEGQIIASEWILQDLIYTYVNSSTFKTNGDTTSVFIEDRRVKMDLLASTSYADVVSSTFSAGETTVVVSTTAMDNTLVSVSYGIVSPYLGAGGGSLSIYTRKEVDAAALERRKLYAKESVTITPFADLDYTLTADENLYGKLTLVDGSWTATHNIIVDISVRDFIVDNSAGTYVATIKTSAGTGITVLAGTTKELYSDGTDVIDISLEVAKANLNASGAAPIYASRAWVNFDGTGTVAIRASGNVSSISDNGVGLYAVNFITAIEDIDYEIQSTSSGVATVDPGTVATTTSASIRNFPINSAVLTDNDRMNVSIFR